MKYERFEDLPVWNAAVELGVRVYALTKDRAFVGSGDLSSQIRRAALSVSNNIAEGFERGTTAELLTFLYIARGSAGEVRSMLHFMDRLIAGRGHSGTRQSGGSQSGRGHSDRGHSGRGHSDRSTRPDADSSEGLEPSASAESDISNMKSQISDPFSKLTSEIAQLKSLAESCSRQIRAWAASLQDSDIKGQRHLTQSGRESYDAKRRAEAFWSHVDAVIQNRFPGAKDPPE